MLFADRINMEDNDKSGEEKSDGENEFQEEIEEMSFLGPQLEEDSLSSIESRPSLSKALKLLESYRKGYKQVYKRRLNSENRKINYILKKEYDDNPMKYWGDATAVARYDKKLVEFSTWVYSVKSASASPERVFSQMKYLVSARRSSITAQNTDMRLTVASLLPLKRKLEDVMNSRSLKRAMVFKSSK